MNMFTHVYKGLGQLRDKGRGRGGNDGGKYKKEGGGGGV